MTARGSRKILGDAEHLMRLVEESFRHLCEGPEDRRFPGLRNLVVFGEAMLAQMRILSAATPLFAAWFEQQEQASSADPQLAELAKLRKAVLREPKERREFTELQLASAGKGYGRRPENARAFFSGDRLGGSGWEIAVPGGAVEKYYVALPMDHGPAGYRYESDTKSTAKPIEPLARRYLNHLREVFRFAKASIH
jgi:hypothetical protein